MNEAMHPLAGRSSRGACVSAVAYMILFLYATSQLAAQRRTTLGQPAQVEYYTDSIPRTLVRFEMAHVHWDLIGRTAGGVSQSQRSQGAIDISRTEVTWDMYDVFALKLDRVQAAGVGADAHARPSSPYGAPDYGWGHAGYPVMSVTRAAAEAFCAWLSEKTGSKYRLPTEAEWETVAKMGVVWEPFDSIMRDSLAWYRGNSEDQTHAVAKRRADGLGLYDMYGNVAEWVTTTDDALVARGGSFRDRVENIGFAARAVQTGQWNERDPQLPKSRWWLSDGPFIGFRIVREQPPQR